MSIYRDSERGFPTGWEAKSPVRWVRLPVVGGFSIIHKGGKKVKCPSFF